MGMKALAASAVKTAFKVAGDLKVAITVRQIEDNGIDAPTENDITENAIRVELVEEDIRGLKFRDRIQPTDIVLALPTVKVATIDMNDKVWIDSIEYSVFGVDLDPSGSLWTIGVR